MLLPDLSALLPCMTLSILLIVTSLHPDHNGNQFICLQSKDGLSNARVAYNGHDLRVGSEVTTTFTAGPAPEERMTATEVAQRRSERVPPTPAPSPVAKKPVKVAKKKR